MVGPLKEMTNDTDKDVVYFAQVALQAPWTKDWFYLGWKSQNILNLREHFDIIIMKMLCIIYIII